MPVDARVLAAALDNAGSLQTLVTRWCGTHVQKRLLKNFGLSRIAELRPTVALSGGHVRECIWADIRDQAGRLFGEAPTRAVDASFAMVDRVGAESISVSTNSVIGREDACLETFAAATLLKLQRVYILPTAHFQTVQRLLSKEAEEFPEVFPAHEIQTDFAATRLERKARELASATDVVCISSFVERTVKEVAVNSRTVVLPLGADADWPNPGDSAREPVFIYVGSISGRKGIHRLLRAWKQLKAHHTHRLKLIGSLNLPASFLRDYQGCFEHQPRLPRAALVREYSASQAMVFNPVADGFGNVIMESMVCGTPVLASRNSGAPDVMQDGEQGLLFNYGDEAQLTGALDWALTHPTALRDMGRAARQQAVNRSWREFQRSFMSWFGQS